MKQARERAEKMLAERLDGLTYESIGDHFDLTRERIRQIVPKIARQNGVQLPEKQGQRCLVISHDHWWNRRYPPDG